MQFFNHKFNFDLKKKIPRLPNIGNNFVFYNIPQINSIQHRTSKQIDNSVPMFLGDFLSMLIYHTEFTENFQLC